VLLQVGRGFYEFTKPETVQKYKEIILMDKNGDMFEGDYARELLNLPKGFATMLPNSIAFNFAWKKKPYSGLFLMQC
jgi:hypothetical protein